MEYLQIILFSILLIGGLWFLYSGLTHVVGEKITIILLDILNLLSGGLFPISDNSQTKYKTRSKKIAKGLIQLGIAFACLMISAWILISTLKKS